MMATLSIFAACSATVDCPGIQKMSWMSIFLCDVETCLIAVIVRRITAMQFGGGGTVLIMCWHRYILFFRRSFLGFITNLFSSALSHSE